MRPQTVLLLEILLGSAAFLGVVYLVHRNVSARARVVVRWLAAAVAVAAFFELVRRNAPDHQQAVNFVKVAMAVLGAAAVFYEAHRVSIRRPIAERWKKVFGIMLGISGIALYFNGFKLGYHEWYHRHDQFHYYLGAKYFPELHYDGLYRCVAVAQDELGVVENPKTGRKIDIGKEVRHPDRKIRDLSNTNLLIPAYVALEKKEECKARFEAGRWEAFKGDVKFFRLSSDKQYWEDMQKDHGYNPPPVWTLGGRLFASLAPASTNFQQFLAALDVLYMLGMFAGLYWAFGWRVFAVAGVLWGCEHAAEPYYWTGGAFLRQDWLFWTVMAMCFARKHYFKLSAASLVYATALRIFPGLLILGWLVVAGVHLHRHRRLAPHHLQMLIGGAAAGALLFGASVASFGVGSYKEFYHHTIQVHDKTPLTNHMGLRTILSHGVGSDKESGRMKYTKDTTKVDPFETWKSMRNERYRQNKWLSYAIVAATLAAFFHVVRRVRSMWVAQGLALVFCIVLVQLTNYYYAFLICAAPLTRLARPLELVCFGLVVLTQMVAMPGNYYWYDDRFTMLSALCLLFGYALLAFFWPRKPAAELVEREAPRAASGA